MCEEYSEEKLKMGKDCEDGSCTANQVKTGEDCEDRSWTANQLKTGEDCEDRSSTAHQVGSFENEEKGVAGLGVGMGRKELVFEKKPKIFQDGVESVNVFLNGM